jgi:hypothetical protein
MGAARSQSHKGRHAYGQGRTLQGVGEVMDNVRFFHGIGLGCLLDKVDLILLTFC